jgi:membrane protease subunit HflK
MTARRWLLMLALLALVGYLLTGVTQVRPGERAVVRRFGRVLGYQPEPGLWVGLPWGMDRVDRVAVDQPQHVVVGYRQGGDEDNLTTPPGQLLTGDHNLVNAQAIVNYTVKHTAVEDYVMHADEADGLVARATETAMAEWVAGRTVDEVLLRGKVELPPWLIVETQRRLEPYHIGVAIRDANIALLSPPGQVKAAFDQVTEVQATISTNLNNAEQQAQRALRQAEADAYRLRQLAAAYAGEQRLLARAEADSFERRLKQYQETKRTNPDALSAIWWDEMTQLYARLREGGRVDLLDHHLGPDGLDITILTPPKKK